MGSLAYIEVEGNDVDDDDDSRMITISNAEGLGDEVDEVPLSSRMSRSGRLSGTPVVVVFSFVIGCLFGSLVVFAGGYWHASSQNYLDHERASEFGESTSQPIDGNDLDVNAVSYNFLRTTKGSETMRLLLNDLLLPKQIQQGNPADEGHSYLFGPRRALTHLQILMDVDGQVSSSCHPLAHNLGRVAYQIFGSLDAAYDGMVGTDDAHLLRLCNAAYLHGVIEFHLRDVPLDNLENAASEIESNVCVELGNVDQGIWECHHGIGHGIIQRHRMEAETDVIQKSRNSCEEVFGASSVDCMNGVWMDHFAVSGNILAMETKMMAADVVANEVKGALSFLAESQNELGVAASRLPPLPPTLQICHLSSTIYDCFIYAATEYLLVHPRDYLGAIQYCTDPSANIESDKVRFCVRGAAIQCAKENMQDFFILEEVCQTLNDENEGIACFQSGLHYFQMSTENESPRDVGLCDNLTRYKFICLGD
ncbi:hypothetical protein ACHAW5_003500 [Stephanodiscus triporus]|uniref:Uncharacterized protein n=1 Tax=Stephanodiscus triporus TaxID=2934178 RepID=A0ABD3NKJ1_9STRA